jgi:hypothetical protein
MAVNSPESQRLAPNQDYFSTGEREDPFQQIRGNVDLHRLRRDLFFCSSGNDTFAR